jgi:hypothetical protein
MEKPKYSQNDPSPTKRHGRQRCPPTTCSHPKQPRPSTQSRVVVIGQYPYPPSPNIEFKSWTVIDGDIATSLALPLPLSSLARTDAPMGWEE